MSKVIRKSKEEREIEICEGAKTAFLEKGFKKTTMEDVIEKTSLSKGGVYRYFKSTKAIMLYILEKHSSRELEQIKSRAKESKQFSKQDKFKEVIIEHFLDEVLDLSDQRKIVKMFINEIAYDDEFRDVYLEMEKKQIELFFRILEIDTEYKSYGVYMFRAHIGISYMNLLLEDNALYEANNDVLEKVYTMMYNELLSKLERKD